MSKYDKLLERLLTIPSDFKYMEVKKLFLHIGFKEINKGKTSGSRTRFYRESDKAAYTLHKPHPEDVMCKAALREIVAFLKGIGEI